MNKIIFTLLLGMIANLAFPQTYHKLIRTNTFSISDIIPGVYFYPVKSNQFNHYGKLTIY